MRNTLVLILVALLVNLVLAATPGCLLQAVNTQIEPGDLSAVCGNGAKEIQAYIAGNCGAFEESAQQAFFDTCTSAGMSVASYTANTVTSTTSSASATATTSVTSSLSSSSSTSTETDDTTTTSHTSVFTSTATSTFASSVSSTAGANIEHKQGAISPMAAAAVAWIGAVAAL